MPGHPRLYRRGATYYHRAAIPVDIADTYPKSEKTFSLRTKDYQDALKRVRVEAVRVDQLFDEHRRRLAFQAQPGVSELSEEQIRHVGEVYYAHLWTRTTRSATRRSRARPSTTTRRTSRISTR